MNKSQEGAARGGDPKPRRGGKKPPAQNPIEAAVTTWLRSPPLAERGRQPDHEQLLAQTPKRWTVYEPMVLLPAGAFGSPAWRQVLDTSPSPSPCPEDEEGNGEARKRASVVADQLWRGILSEISKRHGAARLTHLAVNEGIPLHHTTSSAAVGDSGKAEEQEEGEGKQNILRSPSGLRVLHGDFGPAALLVGGGTPSAADFERAFWASTKQNGIFQTWAPRWTMFSRGNVKEKARLLGFHDGGDARHAPSPSPSPSSSPSQSQSLREHGRAAARTVRLTTAHAVDLYAGIGYFAFSYARLGMRVLCWELNPWSVEGLRRGARGNGWSVRVVRGDELSSSSMAELLAGGEQIVVFQEDNARAAARIAEVRRLRRGDGDDGDLDVLHVNCGLLPASDASWRGAWDIVVGGVGEAEAWLHLHENVGVADIEGRRGEIERWFGELAEKESDKARRNDGDGSSQQWTLVVYVDHVERVKTFAPGVWHCVFDLYIAKKNITT